MGDWGGGVCKGSTRDGLYSLLGRACFAQGKVSEFLYYFPFFPFGFSQCGKRKRRHTEGLVWLKSLGGCELWQHSHDLSPPVSASRATQTPGCVLGALSPRYSKMKLWRSRAALAAFNKGCSSTRALSPHRRDSELSCVRSEGCEGPTGPHGDARKIRILSSTDSSVTPAASPPHPQADTETQGAKVLLELSKDLFCQ